MIRDYKRPLEKGLVQFAYLKNRLGHSISVVLNSKHMTIKRQYFWFRMEGWWLYVRGEWLFKRQIIVDCVDNLPVPQIQVKSFCLHSINVCSVPTEKKKRKLLYGGHCNTELELLRSEIRRHGTLPPLSRIKELSNPKTYLCRHCQTLLWKKKELEDNLQSKIKEIDQRLGLLTARNQESRKQTVDQEEDGEVINEQVVVRYSSLIRMVITYCTFIGGNFW